jgi:serine/threonine-protein kinase
MSEIPPALTRLNSDLPNGASPACRVLRRWREGPRPDLREVLAEAAGLSVAGVLAVLRLDQRQRWQGGERLPAEEYLRHLPAGPTSTEHALDLVYGEFLARERLGEAPSLDEYADRFPDLAPDLRLQVDLHRALGSGPVIAAGPDDGSAPPTVPGYEVMDALGRGGMGVVYRARQVGLKRLVALKMLTPRGGADPEQLARFRAEGEAVARLKHPNIVQIYEVGEHRGQPYFSLELVEDGSLDRKLAGKPVPPSEAAALVETLARAMHYAHERGIVHRDLKPANVLLQRKATAGGTDGGWRAVDFEPKVSDFGLAKCLDGQAGQTHSGAVMGTPAYMAPEQAAGRTKEVGPAADVYALGAILYELLVGRPPFNGASPLETLEQVRSQEPVSPRRLQPKVPRDLETVCLKCLRTEPARRYASAAELADDLGRFRRGEAVRARPVGRVQRLARWCRRNPVVAALGAALALAVVAGLIATVILYLDADSQRRQAEANLDRARLHLGDALTAADQFFRRVSEEDLLRQPDMEGLRKDLLTAAVTFLKKQAAYCEGQPWFEAERARAYGRLADITREIASRQEAIATTLQAQAIFARLHRDHPKDPEFLDGLATAYQHLGNLYLEGRQLDQAEQALQQALALWQLPPDARADREAWLTGLATTHLSLGRLYTDTARTDRAEQAYRKAVSVLEQPGPSREKAPRLHRLGVSYSTLGLFLRDLSRTREAAAAHQKAVQVLEPLVRDHGDVPAYRDALALAHLNLGLVYRDTGRPELAGKAYGRAAELFEELARDHPRVAVHQVDLASSHSNLGVLHREAGKLDLAEKAFDRATAVRAELVRRRPDMPEYRLALGESHNNRALVYIDGRRLREAEKALREAVACFEELVRAHPTVGRYVNRLASTQNNLAGFYVNSRRPAKAGPYFRKAAEHIAPLIVREPKVAEYRHTGSLIDLNQGHWHRVLGWPQEADQAFTRAVAALQKLHHDHPAVADFAEHLAEAQDHLAHVCQVTRGRKEVEAAFQEAVALRERLVRAQPQDPRQRSALGQLHNDRGIFLGRAGQADGAETAFKKALELRSRLAEEHPGMTPFAVDLAGTLCNLGHFAAEQGRREEALAQYGRALDTLQRAGDDPRAKEYRANTHAGRVSVLLALSRSREAVEDLDQVVNLMSGPRQQALRLLRARTLLKLGEHARAAADADVLAGQTALAPKTLYDLAAVYAGAHQATRADPKLSAADRGERTEHYASKAVQALQRARDAGLFADAASHARVRTNPDLASLRQHAAFEAFLADLDR